MDHTITGYVRATTSGDSDTQRHDAEVQERKIRQYVGEVLRKPLSRTFVEAGVSAAVPFEKRPVGADALGSLQEGDAVIACAPMQVCRSAIDCLKLIGAFESRHASLHLVEIGEVTAEPVRSVFMKTVSGFADLERERVREATLKGHATRRSQGKHVSGRLPFGYDVRDGLLVENPEQQAAIRRMRELRAEHKSYRAIRDAIKQELGMSLSAFGIQNIVENKRQIDEEAIRRNTVASANADAKSVPAPRTSSIEQWKKIRNTETERMQDAVKKRGEKGGNGPKPTK